MSQNVSLKRVGINEVQQMYNTVNQTQRRVFYV
jgi:hypothetical protein